MSMLSDSLIADIDMLFEEAVGVQDTIWYSDIETLRDAIVRTILEYKEENDDTE